MKYILAGYTKSGPSVKLKCSLSWSSRNIKMSFPYCGSFIKSEGLLSFAVTSVELFSRCFCLDLFIAPIIRLWALLSGFGSCLTSSPSLIVFLITPTFTFSNLNAVFPWVAVAKLLSL